MSAFEDDVEAIPEPATEPSTSALRHNNPDRDLSPEPDQDLNTSRGAHQVWLVKVPKFLIDGWSQVHQDDVRLGTVRVYEYVTMLIQSRRRGKPAHGATAPRRPPARDSGHGPEPARTVQPRPACLRYAAHVEHAGHVREKFVRVPGAAPG